MRLTAILCILLAGCLTPPTEPSAPLDAGGNETLAIEPPMSEPWVERQHRSFGIEFFDDGWTTNARLSDHVEHTLNGTLLELDITAVPVQLRFTGNVTGVAMVHAWSESCCSWSQAGPWTLDVDQEHTVTVPPGAWVFEAYLEHPQYFGNAMARIEVESTWTIHGTVLPLPVEPTETPAMQEVRIDKGGYEGALKMDLRSDGDIRDLRLAFMQSNWVQCAPPPTGSLANNNVFMEAYMEPMLTIGRVMVGDIPACRTNGAPPINAGPAEYSLHLSL